jgi:hypothetical protein
LSLDRIKLVWFWKKKIESDSDPDISKKFLGSNQFFPPLHIYAWWILELICLFMVKTWNECRNLLYIQSRLITCRKSFMNYIFFVKEFIVQFWNINSRTNCRWNIYQSILMVVKKIKFDLISWLKMKESTQKVQNQFLLLSARDQTAHHLFTSVIGRKTAWFTNISKKPMNYCYNQQIYIII